MTLINGTRVITTKDAGATDWNWSMRRPKWGWVGTVVHASDGHGLCCLVEHYDGTSSWYEPAELQPFVALPMNEIPRHSLRDAIAAEVRAQVEREIVDYARSCPDDQPEDICASILASDYPKEPTL